MINNWLTASNEKEKGENKFKTYFVSSRRTYFGFYFFFFGGGVGGGAVTICEIASWFNPALITYIGKTSQ